MNTIDPELVTVRGHQEHGIVAYYDALYAGMRAPGCYDTPHNARTACIRYFQAEERWDPRTRRFRKVSYSWLDAPGRLARAPSSRPRIVPVNDESPAQGEAPIDGRTIESTGSPDRY